MRHYTALQRLRGEYFDWWFDTWLLFDSYPFHGEGTGPDELMYTGGRDLRMYFRGIEPDGFLVRTVR